MVPESLVGMPPTVSFESLVIFKEKRKAPAALGNADDGLGLCNASTSHLIDDTLFFF